MQGRKDFAGRIYYGLVLDDLVPQDHLVRKLDKLISFDWVREKTKCFYSHTGRPSIDPAVLVKMLVIGYFYDIRSERRLVEEIGLNLAYRWYVGYDIDERIPDHSIFTKCRKRFGKKLFVQIFDQVLAKCIEGGLVKSDAVILDSTLVKANASMDSLVEVNLSPDEYWRELDASEMPHDPRGRKPKEQLSGQVGLHFDGQKIQRQKLGRRRRNREVSYLKRRSKTDPDATVHYRPGTGPMLSYKAHIAADSGGIITAVAVSPSAMHDSAKAPDLIEQHEKKLGTPSFVAADTCYGTQECLGYMQEKGIKTVVRPASTNNRPGYFPKDLFTYDPQKDSFLCPAGKTLKRKAKNNRTNQIMYIARIEDCQTCQSRCKCIEPHRKGPRRVSRFDSDYCEKARLWCRSPMGRTLYRLRKTVMEGLVGEAKTFHGLSRAKLRGIDKVEIQLLLTATVLNLKRLFKKLEKETVKRSLESLQNNVQNSVVVRFIPRFAVRRA